MYIFYFLERYIDAIIVNMTFRNNWIKLWIN